MRKLAERRLYDRTLEALAKQNAGAREAMSLGMQPDAVLHYATHWPMGIGKDVKG